MTISRMWKTLVALAFLALVTGCFKVEAEIVIDDDGSGTVDMLTAIDTDSMFGAFAAMDLPEDQLGDVDDLCSEFSTDMTQHFNPITPSLARLSLTLDSPLINPLLDGIDLLFAQRFFPMGHFN